jgi:hypothetical protein
LGLFRALTIGAFILAVPLALITTNIRIAISEQPVYDYAVGTTAPKMRPASRVWLLAANDQIHDYLVHNRTGSAVHQRARQWGRCRSLVQRY